ncbi:MAG: helix-turn-helix transcriptional regulator [Candidatus Wallbacteria bacterium]|nr:helix-turn-helix transcriptional regulator [Candidatus Wallbacteria bacterium]
MGRKLGITRSRLDDILTGRGPCDEETAQALARALSWPELCEMLLPQPAGHGRSRKPGKSTMQAQPIVRETAGSRYGEEPPRFVVEYPADLPNGVPLWAVVVIEQARGLGKRPTPEDPGSPESWALAAAALVRDIAVELQKDFEDKRSRR